MSPADDTPVRVGGRYRLDERIGAGAMGAVWRATDELLNRTVAVKELLAAAAPPTTAGHDALEESRQRILREGRIGAKLRHPHVISMFDVVVHDDRPWLVMEYLRSESLAQVLAQGPLPAQRVADIGRQVADGLAAAHDAGIVHRDVKPGNVLIADDGLVKITDFGVSRAVDDVQLTRTGLIAGTPAYIAPEVARGANPASPSDIFALGATLYAAIEGAPPFGLDDNAYALLHKVATADPNPPTRTGPVVDVIMQLLRRDPERRMTAEQARDALAAVGRGRPAVPPQADPAAARTLVAAAPVAAPSRPAPPPAKPATNPNLAPVGAPARRQGMRRMPLLLAILAVLAAGAGVAAAIITGAADGAQSQGDPLAQPTETVAPTAAPDSATAAPTTTEAPVPTTAPLIPAGGDPVEFVRSYYALLPGNADAAWELLGPQAQAASGGREIYVNFYAGITSITLQNVQQIDNDTVQATVVFTTRDGATTNEPYQFNIGTDDDGSARLDSYSRL